jgi:hypothetical protein
MRKTILTICLLTIYVTLFAQNSRAKQKPTAGGSSELNIPFTANRWEFQNGKVEFLEYKNQKAVKLDENSGVIFLKDVNFANGTIEFDVEVNQALPFPAIYFRQIENNAEHVYLRTGSANKKNAFDALQYASIINGVNIWDLQHEFQTAANIKIGEWNHIKLIVSGMQLRVYVNNQLKPNLEIPCMEGNTDHGRIGLGTGFPGQSIFANLIIRPNIVENLPDQPAPDITRHDTRYIRQWQTSKPVPLPVGNELNVYMIPKLDSGWENIIAERRGLVNLSRKFGSNGKRTFVWLKAKINSEVAQSQVLKMGFSDEVWVFVNQKPVYVDKDNYILNMRKSPNGRISLDNCSFQLPLLKGENELLIGVANDFYGWGLMARFENLDGIEIH